jgi:hypothetical protein
MPSSLANFEFDEAALLRDINFISIFEVFPHPQHVKLAPVISWQDSVNVIGIIAPDLKSLHLNGPVLGAGLHWRGTLPKLFPQLERLRCPFVTRLSWDSGFLCLVELELMLNSRKSGGHQEEGVLALCMGLVADRFPVLKVLRILACRYEAHGEAWSDLGIMPGWAIVTRSLNKLCSERGIELQVETRPILDPDFTL